MDFNDLPAQLRVFFPELLDCLSVPLYHSLQSIGMLYLHLIHGDNELVIGGISDQQLSHELINLLILVILD